MSTLPVADALNTQQRFSRQFWLDDYQTLKVALEHSYSNLAWFASPEGGVDLPALNRRTLAALRKARSDAEARTILLNFVTAFHDGHFSQLPELSAALGPELKSAQPYIYDRRDPIAGCAALGYAIDGRVAFSLPFESLSGFKLIADGDYQPFRAGVLAEQGVRVGIVRIASFKTQSYPALCRQSWEGQVWDKQGELKTSDLQDAIDRRWYEAVAALLVQFRAENVNAVIVDIGNNSGGNDSGDMVARLFTSRPLRSAKLTMSQDAVATRPYFREQLGELARAASFHPSERGQALIDNAVENFQQEEAKLSTPCAMAWTWLRRERWEAQRCRRLVQAGSAGGPLDYLEPGVVSEPEVDRRLHWPAEYRQLWGTWTGPLYVLTNGRTYSSAEMFAAVLQNNGAARIAGTQTGGDGCGFMNDPEPLTLPHSQLRFRIPNCVRLRADGTDEVAGITPDLPLLPLHGEDARSRAYRLVFLLNADLKRSLGNNQQNRF